MRLQVFFRCGGRLRPIFASITLLSAGAGSWALSACGAPQGAPAADPTDEPIAAAPQAQPQSAAIETPAGDPGVAAQEPPRSPPAPPILFPDAVFPPQDPGAPYERSKREGDGVWTAFFHAAEEDKKHARTSENTRADFGAELVRRIVVHPHEASRFQTLTVAAFDLRALRVAHRPGQQDVEDVGHKELADRAGLVPSEEQRTLFAVFNGGFQPRHGRWGMLSLDTQLIEPRDDACTVAILKDGTVRIGPWPELVKIKEQIQAYRQTPPCLVNEGTVHKKLANLSKPDRGPWAGQQKDLKTRRRSTVGVSEDGRTLFFGVGGETEPEVLAAGMAHLGAHSAAQLDINWNWTRLFLFDQGSSGPEIQGSLIEDMARDRGEYVSRAGKRGFFYLTRRTSGEANAPPSGAPAPSQSSASD